MATTILTRPSNLLRRLLCPGSARLEAKVKDNDTRDAKLGRLFHKYWTHPELDRAFLKPAERDLLVVCDRLLNDVLNKLAFETEHGTFIEQTLTAKDGRLSGTPDLVYGWRPRKTALVVDLKSGFYQVEAAELNLQLRAYAVLVADNTPPNESIDAIYVAILQPRLWSPSERITMALYREQHIKQSRAQINGIIDATLDKKAPLHAGAEQCGLCRAKLICPAFRKYVGLPLAKFKTDDELSKARREAEIEQRLKGCTDEQLEQVLEAVKLAAAVGDLSRTEARRRIRAGGFTKFMLGKEWSERSITNARRAIALLALSGVATREQVLDSCTIPLQQIEENYRARHNGMTWNQARDKINRVLAAVIEKEQREPKIIRK